MAGRRKGSGEGAKRLWSREHSLAALALYARTPFGRMHKTNPDVIDLARLLGRTPSSVSMKLCNYAALDPALQARGIKGLAKNTVQDRAILSEYQQDWERVSTEAEEAMVKLTSSSLPSPFVSPSAPEKLPRSHPSISDGITDSGTDSRDSAAPTESLAVRRQRIGQHVFRMTVLAGYDNSCAMCDIDLPELLNASHIVPWASVEAHRRNPSNGLCLCTLHDRAFDRALIGLDGELRVVVAPRIEERLRRLANSGDESVLPMMRPAFEQLKGRSLRLPWRFAPDASLLAEHRARMGA